MNLTLLNRNFTLPKDDWYHVMPLGEYPHPDKLSQVLDTEGAAEMVNRFKADSEKPNFPGLLVDFDHFSDDAGKPSEAAGWLTDVQNRGDGLWGKIRWSDTGEAAVKGGRYRLVSPVFARDGAVPLPNAAGVEAKHGPRLRPTRLLKVALTNDPNLKGMVPLTNRAQTADSKPQHTETKHMTKIATLFGLSADASEDALHAEATKIINRATTAEARAVTLETENKTMLSLQVDADLERFSNRYKPEAKDKIKAQLLSNRAATIELLESIPEVKVEGAASGNILNRAQAKTPGATASNDIGAKINAKVMEIRNRAGGSISYDKAFTQARHEAPELFATETK